MAIQWIAILRDALAIVVVRSLMKWFVGLFDASDGVMGGLDFVVLVVAFCAVGCANPAQRYSRLGLTASCSWAITAAVGLLRGAGASYGLDLVTTLLAMLLGGAASLAVVRPGRDAGGAGGSAAVDVEPHDRG